MKKVKKITDVNDLNKIQIQDEIKKFEYLISKNEITINKFKRLNELKSALHYIKTLEESN